MKHRDVGSESNVVPLQADFGRAFAALRQRARALRSEPWQARRDRLKALRAAFIARRQALQQALAADLGRPAAETDIVEYMPVLSELDSTLAQLRSWAAPRRVPTPLPLFGARSEIRLQPKGVCLILAPWNYPASLILGPLVSCIAAGNTAVLKPSEFTPATSAYLRELIAAVFPSEEVFLMEGGPETAAMLLEQPFDHIFFTGSPHVGRIVMAAAAKGPTSVTLELGGKSPVLVHRSADLEDAARKLVWGKFVNAGQTCIAPDYILAEAPIASELSRLIAERMRAVYPAEVGEGRRGPDYGAIVSARHAQRLLDMIEDARGKGASVLAGGRGDAKARFVAPTLIGNVRKDMLIDQEEIFGPLLPIRAVASVDEAISHVNAGAPPLSSYVFARDGAVADRFITEAPAGGSCVNHVLVHYGNENLPFGGIGPSGIGRSHGRAGFEAFSNIRTVMRDRFTQTQLFFPPYTKALRGRIAAFLRLKRAA
jgi:aldehyde dehydrogenase (NAD+)